MSIASQTERAHRERRLRMSMNAVPDDGINLKRISHAYHPPRTYILPSPPPASLAPLPRYRAIVPAARALLVFRLWPTRGRPRVFHQLEQLRTILRTVAQHYNVSPLDILSIRQFVEIAWPRHIGMFIGQKLTTCSLSQIGQVYGGRDHATVHSAIAKIERKVSGSDRVASEVELLTALCRRAIAH